MNEIKRERHTYKAKNTRCCPFCGGASISVIHKELRFLGVNGIGDKKIKMKVYCICYKCKAAGTPVFYIGHTLPKADGYNDDHLPIYACGNEAIDAWNRRPKEEKTPVFLQKVFNIKKR